jgi:hypothetical protein
VDRPAFRTPFHQESSLPRFRSAIAETIAIINTGVTPSGKQLPSKHDVHDPEIQAKLDAVVEGLVALRSAFDDLLRSNEIRPCGCQNPDCPIYMLSDRAAWEMDRRRQDLLLMVHQIEPSFPACFYELH